MLRIAICGTGNLASHLSKAFGAVEEVEIVGIAGRNKKDLYDFSQLAKTTTNFSSLEKADVYFLAVADGSIREVSDQIPKGLVVHCSGSTAMDQIIGSPNRGVFYPLQTFSKDLEVDFREIPICIEAEKENDYQLLKELGHTISRKVIRVNSAQRSQLHLAAVFVNNFSNHLFHIGQEICEQNELNFDLLHGLIDETVRKIKLTNPYEAQTGPARRGDLDTLQAQLEQLDNISHKEIYKQISESILNTYAEKL